MSADTPDLTAILDDLFIGNLASAKSLHDHPELGITHILSVCPDYPEASIAANDATLDSTAHCPTVAHPKHRCISIEDSEYEDILVHLPSAIAFIKNALEKSQTCHVEADENAERGGDARPHHAIQEGLSLASTPKHRVLVHCVMGISRSTTIVCAYLMATRHISPSVALKFIRKRRPLAHPNYGFRRQLAIFADCDYFEDYRGPVRSHPAHACWLRKRDREAKRFLARLDDVVEVKIDSKGDDGTLSITDDFPTDSTEAACLLSEVEVTHFLSISPASMPALPPSQPASTVSPNLKKYKRPALACPPISSSSSSSSGLGSSPSSSPLSSRSSSFSFASHLSGLSTAATSLVSLPSLTPLSKLRSEASFESSDDEADEEPTFLALAGVKHYHLEIPGTSPADLLFRLKEGASFIRCALGEDVYAFATTSDSDSDCEAKSASEKSLKSDSKQRKHILIHSTTESRACAIFCAYLMSSRGMTPLQAYSLLEEALPLFNPTKSFLKQLELFHACEYNPTPEHPLVRAWLTCSSESAAAPALSSFVGPGRTTHPRTPVSTHWKSDSDVEGDSDGFALRRKLGTPARCGSFAGRSSSMKPSVSKSAHVSASMNESESASVSVSMGECTVSGGGGVPTLACTLAGSGILDRHQQPGGTGELEELLQRCEGVGDPGFAFDVEAFRGALRGIATDRDAN
ncbi:hypothetical protein EW145_g1543 [Phellinidium pouzarii]|uniref:protein-tyrosine-phosphatase n=1 Tax=Phellinidium pouzarii TaxID=167371 RepID=A0A4S4LG07_9AGAM|nr:hypothetical protein EW145_g1543 [Phellinidium pouzarii]